MLLIVATFAFGGGTLTAAGVPDTDLEQARWVACMSSRTPPIANIRSCTEVLGTRPLSRLHRSLLLTVRGEPLARLAHYARAIGDYNSALAETPGDETLLADRAEALEDSGRLAEAERDYSAAIARHLADPTNRTNGSVDVLADFYAMRGRERLKACRAAEALADFNRALITYPQGPSSELHKLRAAAVERVRDRRPYTCQR